MVSAIPPILQNLTFYIIFQEDGKDYFIIIINIYGPDNLCSNDSSCWELMVIDEPPHFNDDKNGLKRFVQNQIKYPNEAINDRLEGTVIISFYIDTTGVTTDHKIVKGIRKDLNSEALRVAKLIRFEEPAMQKGKPIKVKFTVPVVFKLPNEKEKY